MRVEARYDSVGVDWRDITRAVRWDEVVMHYYIKLCRWCDECRYQHCMHKVSTYE
jgi:hypothetical protein